MMKFWSCWSARNVLLASKAGYQNNTINMFKATSFSSINRTPQNIHSNKVDAPFAGTKPNVTKPILDEDNDKSYRKNNKEGESMTEQATGFVEDSAKRGTKGVVETAFNVGEKLAEGMEETLGTVKETTKKVKDTVLGKYDDVDERGEDSREKVDKHVKDLRTKAGGYDQRPH